MKNIEIPIKQRFGKLVVIKERFDIVNIRRPVECLCDCGSVNVYSFYSLKFKDRVSCGCGRSKIPEFHGMSLSPEYNSWSLMRDRCNNPKNPSYARYGQKGITVCNEWRNSFINFYADMGPKSSAEHTIDRIDGTKGYYKDNCRWATKREQSNNLSSNVYHDYLGKRQTLSHWRDELGFDYELIRSRVANGTMTLAEALALGTPEIPLYKYKEGMVRLCDWCKEFKIDYQWAYKQIKLYNATLENILKLSNITIKTIYTIDGITNPLSWWCFHKKANPRLTIYRLLENWTIEEALTPIEKTIVAFNPDNDDKGLETMTLEEWCDLFRLDKNTTYLRILRGESFESIVAE